MIRAFSFYLALICFVFEVVCMKFKADDIKGVKTNYLDFTFSILEISILSYLQINK